jgi:hypothetical protein
LQGEGDSHALGVVQRELRTNQRHIQKRAPDDALRFCLRALLTNLQRAPCLRRQRYCVEERRKTEIGQLGALDCAKSGAHSRSTARETCLIPFSGRRTGCPICSYGVGQPATSPPAGPFVHRSWSQTQSRCEEYRAASTRVQLLNTSIARYEVHLVPCARLSAQAVSEPHPLPRQIAQSPAGEANSSAGSQTSSSNPTTRSNELLCFPSTVALRA